MTFELSVYCNFPLPSALKLTPPSDFVLPQNVLRPCKTLFVPDLFVPADSLRIASVAEIQMMTAGTTNGLARSVPAATSRLMMSLSSQMDDYLSLPTHTRFAAGE